MSSLPCFDLPTEALFEYSGTNPKPDDFDNFWKETLEQTEAIDPDVHREGVELPLPGVRCAHLFFTGLGGARVYAKFLRPESPHPRGNPGLLHFHGYSVQSAEWFQLYRYASLGFFVLTLDCRGQAGRSEESGGTRFNTLRGQIVRGIYEDPRELRFRYIFSDAYRLATILAGFPEVDATRLAATGGSQGGALSLVAAALYPELNRIVISNPFLCDYQRVWELRLAEEGAYQEIGDTIRRLDPRGEKLDHLFHNLGYIDAAHLASRITARCLMGTGLSDTVCPPSTQFAAYNRIRGPKDVRFYPLYGHELLPGLEDDALREWVPLLPAD